MRFALLGDHPDGLAMARALVESGRHELAAYAGPVVGAEYLRRWQLTPPRLADLEEVLADPSIHAVIVAGRAGHRPAVLRRAVQSERHVLCVHPLDSRADTAYEAAVVQADTGYVLFPILPDTLHPGIVRLAQLLEGFAVSRGSVNITAQAPASAIVPADHSLRSAADAPRVHADLRLIELERWSSEPLLLTGDDPAQAAGLPGWDVLRFLGGEIAEVSASQGLRK